MDTSETYIKMCEQAKEIQEQRPKYLVGDWFWVKRGFWSDSESQLNFAQGESMCLSYVELGLTGLFIWLPRQDQLQEMIPIGKEDAPCSRAVKFVAWLSVYDVGLQKNNLLYGSMEQLWLAFVMHEKYQKVWNSEKEDWVSSKEIFLR